MMNVYCKPIDVLRLRSKEVLPLAMEWFKNQQ